MDPIHEADLKEAAAKIRATGVTPLAFALTDPDLPWVILRAPSLQECDMYASTSTRSPITASIGMLRICIMALPADVDLENLMREKPFLPMRALQSLFASLGMGVRSEKKSLS